MINVAKQSIIFIILCLQSYKSDAQTNISLQMGLSNNYIKSKKQISSSLGYAVTADASFPANDWFDLELSLTLIQKNFSIQNKSNIYQNLTNTYLQLPVGISKGIAFGKNIRLAGFLGIYYALWINKKMDGQIPNIFDVHQNEDGSESLRLAQFSNQGFNSITDNRNEFGWATKLSLDYRFSKSMSLTTGGHYYNSQTNQEKQTSLLQTGKYNKTFVIMTGLKYLLSH